MIIYVYEEHIFPLSKEDSDQNEEWAKEEIGEEYVSLKERLLKNKRV